MTSSSLQGQSEGTAAASVGGPLFAALLERELTNERERRDVLDARALSVITSSGTFVTLSFAVIAVVTKASDYSPSLGTIALLVAAAASLFAAAVLALLAGRLRAYQVVVPSQFETWTQEEYWYDTADHARYLIVRADADTLKTLRRGNDAKADRLDQAMWAQVLAFLILTVAVLVVLGGST